MATSLRMVLHREQSFFPFDTPAIAAHAAVSANDAMARNRDRNRVRGTSPSHRPGGRRLADPLRNLFVRPSRPKGNRLQIPPDPPLEHSSANIERQGRIQ